MNSTYEKTSDFIGTARQLKQDDIIRAAREIKCDKATIWAIAEVESNGNGFLLDNRPKILFEAHIFSSLTDHAFDQKYPNISSARWNKDLYGTSGEHQYNRLTQAMQLNKEAALHATSWGMFQIMGFNFRNCGFSSIEIFIEAMKRSEGAQLDAMLGFVRHLGLDGALQNRDWAAFAKGYNGPRYQENNYDEKLELAWRKYSQVAAGEVSAMTIREVQAALNCAGTTPQLVEDGLQGPKTHYAIVAFQHSMNLEATGIVDYRTMKALLGCSGSAE